MDTPAGKQAGDGPSPSSSAALPAGHPVGDGEGDRSAIRRLSPILKEAIDSVLEGLRNHHLGSLHPAVDEATIDRLMTAHRGYLDLLSREEESELYKACLDRIGMTHARLGISPGSFLEAHGVAYAIFRRRVLEVDPGAESALPALERRMLRDEVTVLSSFSSAAEEAIRERLAALSREREALHRRSDELEQEIADKTLALRLSEERYRSIVDYAADAIILMDTDDVIRSWNRGAIAMFGYTAVEMLGSKFYRLLPPEAEWEIDHIRRQTKQTGILRNFESVRLAKDGKKVFVSITRTLLRNDAGEVIGASAIIRDITPIRTFEERMYRAERVASLGWLASEIAHEVGTPLNVISGRAEQLIRAKEPEDPERRPLEIIVSQIDRISRVMRRALDLVRDPRTETNGPLSADIPEVVKDLLDFFEVKFLSHRITVSQELEPAKAALHRLHLEQLLFNLIQYAIDAMPEGGTLTIRSDEENERCLLAVSDTGIGIQADDRDKIFEPLFTTKTAGHGTGLGLALVRRIVENHRGAIELECQEDEPTMFRIYLPLARRAG